MKKQEIKKLSKDEVIKNIDKLKKDLFNAHDENNKFKTGDTVSIIECKPFSKNKKFQVMDGSK